MDSITDITKDLNLPFSVPLKFLPRDEIPGLLKAATIRTLEKEERLVPKGMIPDSIFIPASGNLREVVLDIEEGEAIPAYHPVGLENLLTDHPFACQVVAAEATVVYAIPWENLGPLIRKTQGLENYLRLVEDSAEVRELELLLGEMDCSPPFRAALLGSLNHEKHDNKTWIVKEGDVPTSIYTCVNGTVQAFDKTGSDAAIKPLWIVPNMTWFPWAPCMEERPSDYLYKSVSNTEMFRLSRRELEALKARFPDDFAAFEKVVAAEVQKEEEPEDDDDGKPKAIAPEKLSDLFPPAPRPIPRFRVSYPFIPQTDKLDNGPACLAMVSKFFGNPLPVQYWRSRLQADQRGTTIFDLGVVAEKAGFVARGLDLRDLTKVDADLFPLVAEKRGEFCVVYAVKEGRITYADTKRGITKIPFAEFARGFDGVVLLLKPKEEFYGEKEVKQGYGHFLEMLRGHGFELMLIFICSFILTVLSTIPAFLSQFIIDQVLAKKDTKLLLFGVLTAVTLTMLIGLTTWIRTYYMAFLTSRFDFGAASAFLRKLYTLPYDFFATRHVGDFTRRLAELERVRSFMTRRLIGTIFNSMNLVVYGVVLFLYSPQVAILVYASAPILTFLSIAFSNHLRLQYNETFVNRSEQDGMLADQIRGIGTLKALGVEVAARWRYEEALVRTLRSRYRYRITGATLEVSSGIAYQVINFLIIGLAAYMAIRGQMTAGQVISVSILAAGVMDPFYALATMWAEIQEVRTVLDRLNDVFLAEPEQKIVQQTLVKKRLRGDIEFQNVWFRYGGESSEWALKGLSFRIQGGQRVAIVGPSGAGKSTLSLLTARLYEPTKGRILVDGRDYREYDRQWLRKNIGLLMQDNDLFHGSILENIAYGDPNPNMSRVEWAASTAKAIDFIQKKSAGYDYMLTHGGKGLSGGQKQRIAIARILYSNPTVLFMDEGTSALDPVSERGIFEALRQRSHDQAIEEALKASAEDQSGALLDRLQRSTQDGALLKALDSVARDRTLLSIMHRYNLVKEYDFIIVINDGRAVEMGTHDELLANSGLYSELFGQDSS